MSLSIQKKNVESEIDDIKKLLINNINAISTKIEDQNALLLKVLNPTDLKQTPLANNESVTSLATTTNQGDTVWILISSALIFLMIIGLGIFYSGFVRRANILTIFLSTYLPAAIVTIQWFIFGYSLVYSNNGSDFIGNFDHVCLIGVGSEPNFVASTLPSNVFMIYQGFFAAISPPLMFGTIAERGTLTSFCLISVFWTTFVYDFIAYWTWNPNGWLHHLGALDFGGGGPVHIASGFGALALALIIGPRKRKLKRPVTFTNIYIGTGMLWLGWMGFNGGSEFALNSRAVNAVIVSNLAACVGGVTWLLIEMAYHRTIKISLNGFCAGAVAGLVAITPAAGFVTPASSIAFGICAPLVCFFACFIKNIKCLKFDDTSDVFGIHGVGGCVGAILTGVFAQNSVATMSGDASIEGGFLDKKFMLILYQLCAVVVSAVWSFVITLFLALIVYWIPFLQLKLDEEEQEIGADNTELGETAFDLESFISTSSRNGSFDKRSQDLDDESINSEKIKLKSVSKSVSKKSHSPKSSKSYRLPIEQAKQKEQEK